MKMFAECGVTTSAIQRVADVIGISQSYVFRLFGSKPAFVLACLDEMEGRVRTVFHEAVETDEDDPLEAMGAGFRSLLVNPLRLPLVALQGRRVRSITELLPAAAGPTTGTVGKAPGPPARIGILGESWVRSSSPGTISTPPLAVTSAGHEPRQSIS